MKPQGAAAIIQQKSLLLFDLDGTLVDSAPDLCRALNVTLAEFGLPSITLGQVRQWVGQGAAHLCRSVLASQPMAQQHALQQPFLEQFLMYYQRDVCIDSQLYPSVVTVLQTMQAQQKKLACITISLINRLSY